MRLSSLFLSVGTCALLTGLGGVLAAPQTQDVYKITIGGASATKVAIAPCTVAMDPLRTSCGVVREVLKADLDFEGFQLTPESLMRSLPPVNATTPSYVDWSSVGANILVTLEVTQTGTQFAVDARTFSVDGKSSIMSKRYAGPVDPVNPNSFRAFAHRAAEDVLSLASIQGVTLTRLVFVSDRDYSEKDKRRKELYISDYDGFNVRQITVNKQLSILPAWAPGGRGVVYTSYRNGDPQIFLSWIFEGRSVQNVMNERPGVQDFAPVISPDGKKIAYMSDRSGNFDIWVANIDGTKAHNLTGTPGEDAAPCWSPSGLEIAFTSGRSGSPQLWVMDSEGLNLRRLSSVGNYNDACAWNPSREFAEIAYSSRLEDNSFEIAVLDLATGQVRQLTTGRGSCEYPSWAPNGRHLVFSCNRGGTWQLAQTDRMGLKIRNIAVGPGQQYLSRLEPDRTMMVFADRTRFEARDSYPVFRHSKKVPKAMRVHHPDIPHRLVPLVLAGALVFPGVARGADKKDIALAQITQQIATLQGQVAQADQSRLEAQRDLKRVTDMLVEQSAVLKKLQQDLKIQDERTMVAIKDLQERLSEISLQLRAPANAPPAAANNTPGGSSAPGAVLSPTPAGPAIPPRDLYQQAYSDFARKNYDLSAQGFQEYLRLYRDTDLADNAQYWIGECLQAQGKYEDAVTAFNALLRDFTDSDKIPDARYKKGVALEALGRKSQAVLEYRFVVERFPNSPAARLAREKLGQP